MMYSVLMSVYFKENPTYLEQAIASMINQTIQTDDFVLVCDGELTEELDNVIEKYVRLHPNIFNVVRLEHNVGLGEALAIGLNVCKNELIARMDSDDVAISNRIELQLKRFNNEASLSVVGGQIVEFENEENSVMGYRIVPEKYEDIKKCAKIRNPMNHVTIMFKKSFVLQAGNYKHFDKHEDYYLWMRMLKKKMLFANLPETLVKVRVGQAMYQRRGGWTYFTSEYEFQRYLLKEEFISCFDFIVNILKRFVVQVMMPNKVRGIIFRRFTRSTKGVDS